MSYPKLGTEISTEFNIQGLVSDNTWFSSFLLPNSERDQHAAIPSSRCVSSSSEFSRYEQWPPLKYNCVGNAYSALWCVQYDYLAVIFVTRDTHAGKGNVEPVMLGYIAWLSGWFNLNRWPFTCVQKIPYMMVFCHEPVTNSRDPTVSHVVLFSRLEYPVNYRPASQREHDESTYVSRVDGKNNPTKKTKHFICCLI